LNLKNAKIDAKTSPKQAQYLFHNFFVYKTQINAYRTSKSMT